MTAPKIEFAVSLADERSGYRRRPAMGDWKHQAACRGMDPNIWHPETGEWPTQARRICFQCPVREACLEWALMSGERKGIWGGTTPRERSQMRRRRSMAS